MSPEFDPAKRLASEGDGVLYDSLALTVDTVRKAEPKERIGYEKGEGS